MSATETQVQADAASAQAAQATESEARRMGWLPKEQWRGAADHWVDAPTFVERGKQVMPILQANNRRLSEEREALQARVAAAEAKNAEFSTQLEQLKTFQADVARQQRERMKAELMREIAAARESGNLAAEVAAQEKITALREPPAAAAEKPNREAKPAAPATPVAELPEMKAFRDQRLWWDTDPAMRGAAVAIAQEMAARGELNGLTPAQRLSKIADAAEARFAPAAPAAARVEGGGRSGAATGGAGSDGGKTFADLPAEARDACLRQADWLVGGKKSFKTLDDWKKRYTQEFFGEE